MKKVISSVLLLLIFLEGTTQQPVTTLAVTAQTRANIAGLYISYNSMGNYIKDSVMLENNQCNYRVKIEEGTTVLLEPRSSNATPGEQIVAYAVPGDHITLAIQGTFAEYVFNGGEVNKDFQDIFNRRKPYLDSMAAMRTRRNQLESNHDQEAMKQWGQSIAALDKTVKESIYLAYLDSHANSLLNPYVLFKFSGSEFDPVLVDAYFVRLPEKVRQWPSVVSFKEMLGTAKRTGIGAMAPVFTMKDAQGNPVSLADFRNKYVLVDFWASWCGPCRGQSPYLVKAFEKYKGKKFTILSISLDKPGEKENWLKAIKDDQLTWTNVSDLNYMQTEVARLYGVDITGIPFNFLVDPSGKIIAKNLRNENIESTLSAIKELN